MNYPKIIQGGMGIAVSNWTLANAVASRGQLGVISGTAVDLVLARRLQLGDVGGHIAEAIKHFPFPEVAKRIWDSYYIKGGKSPEASFKSKPLGNIVPSQALVELMVLANFVEVWLAKRGHDGMIGINLLEKIQLPTVPSLYGAMLAGVDVVLMGAGIPRAIPAILDSLASGKKTEICVRVEGGDGVPSYFDPADFPCENIKRPKFFAIVTSPILAHVLANKCTPPVDGFVVEYHTAGGHNAPPRGHLQLTESGEPIYGERDIPDLAKFRDIGLPFWLAGSVGTAEKLQSALAEGAQGIQVGTAFAFCDESGLREDVKLDVIRQSKANSVKIYTDAKASPTGFPFKVVPYENSLSQLPIYTGRTRICDLGYLRECYKKEDGSIGYRCPSEPIEDFVKKGGDIAETVGRKCICNGLMSTIDLGQVRKGFHEPAIVTAGDEVAHVSQYLKPGADHYSVEDVLDAIFVPAKIEG